MPRTLLWCLFLNRKNGAQKSQVTCPRSLSLVSSWAGIQTHLMHLITKLHCFPLVKGKSILQYKTQNYKTAIWGQVPWVCIHFLTEYSQNPCERNTLLLSFYRWGNGGLERTSCWWSHRGRWWGKNSSPDHLRLQLCLSHLYNQLCLLQGVGLEQSGQGQGWRTERTESALTCSSLWGHLVFKDDSQIPNLSQFQ